MRGSLVRLSAVCLIVPALAGCAARRDRPEHFTVPGPLPRDSVLVVGIVGGRDSWDAEHRGVTRLAARLREAGMPGVHVETVEHTRRYLIPRLVGRALPEVRDAPGARLVLYGMSFGGAAVVKTARDLERAGVPVLLTIQVDSIGRGDAVIPANVRCAANFYQRDGLFVRGERAIRAEDPERTTILGNVRLSYRRKAVDLSGVSRVRRVFFRTAHFKMNLDPDVWERAGALIRDVAAARDCPVSGGDL